MILGIDVGGSTTKIVGIKPTGEYVGMLQVDASDQITSAFGAFGKFAATYSLRISDIKQIVVTGVGASYLEAGMYDIPTKRIDEFLAIGLGGLKMAALSQALIISAGTGTALVRASKDEIKHLGGSGLGGGTLLSLAERFANAHSFASIISMATKGNLSNVDLRLSDISKEKVGNLPPTATVSNFGNYKDTAEPPDIILGLINMIFESIGMMAIFTTLHESSVKDIVLIGSLSSIPQARVVFDTLSQMYPVCFHIPTNAIYATAIGAALSELTC